MSDKPCLATVLGIPTIPSITEINVRSGPGTNFDIAFKAPVGMGEMEILEVKIDNEGKNKDGKVYQWFYLVFHGGATGWVRGDLLQIEGDCTEWGYGMLSEKTLAFDLKRSEVTVTPAPKEPAQPAKPPPPEKPVQPVKPPPAEEPAQPATPPTPIETPTSAGETVSPSASGAKVENVDQLRKAAFMITAAFEGTGYKAYNNYDAGIVSYGLIQFTLAAGSLGQVVEKYLQASNSDTANALRGYKDAVDAKDPHLRDDGRFKELLLAAADEPEMQQAQEEVATKKYWDSVVDGYITHRGLQTPLGWALLFDMGVNFGTNHAFVRKAEEELGVPPRSRPGENGITEEQLITKVAELRRASHYRQAERDNLPGLKVRGDFWMDLISAGDWALQGDANGNVNVNGRLIQVRKP